MWTVGGARASLALMALALALASSAAASAPSPSEQRRPSALGPYRPVFVKPCRRADPQLNTCVRDSLNEFIRGAAAGVRAWGMPSIDPLEMLLMDLSGSAPGNISLSLVLHGVNVRGFSNSKVITVKANLAEQKLEVTSRVPWLHADGVFAATGAVLSFPLHGRGLFALNMTEVSASWIVYYNEQQLVPNGPDHFQIDHFEFDLTPVDVSFHFGDSLDDDNQLGAAMNEFLNANALEVFGDAKVRVAALLGHALGAACGAVLKVFPADRLLLSDESHAWPS